MIAVLRGELLLPALGDGALIAIFALGASWRGRGQNVRSVSATLGLLVCSAVVVQLFDGAVEAQFHFFVVVAVAALYQQWVPFLLALVFVLVHDGVVGTLMPAAAYAVLGPRPWLSASVHAGFVVAESIACLAYWRVSERAIAREREARVVAERVGRDLASAQDLSETGSWEWDVVYDVATWSDHLYELVGVDPATFAPSAGSFYELVHPDDLDRVSSLVDACVQAGSPIDYECRIVRADGEVRTIHSRGHVTTHDGGEVRHIRGTVQDVTERARLQDAVARLAFQDPLTGLANRRAFVERLDQVLASPSRVGTCAVLFIDLDGFKAVNDEHGHAAGDQLLRETADALLDAKRSTDVVGRLGGDEFAVLCVDGDHDVALLTARRIEEQLRRPTTLGAGAQVVIGASIGIAVASGDDTADGVLGRADAAMYEVKAVGRESSATGAPPVRAREAVAG